jgi:anti-sigma factor (TIGR02949 family)
MTLIDCREAVGRMWAYMSEGLQEDDVAELEAHLQVCERCCGELEFSRELRQRVAGASAVPMPTSVRERITEILGREASEAGQP